MYGTVAPWSVVVDRDRRRRHGAAVVRLERVRRRRPCTGTCTIGAPSHCAFVGTGKPATVLQIHGCTCAPAKTGPPLGWFVTVRWTVGPLRIVAIRSFAPFARPVTTPS